MTSSPAILFDLSHYVPTILSDLLVASRSALRFGRPDNLVSTHHLVLELDYDPIYHTRIQTLKGKGKSKSWDEPRFKFRRVGISSTVDVVHSLLKGDVEDEMNEGRIALLQRIRNRQEDSGKNVAVVVYHIVVHHRGMVTTSSGHLTASLGNFNDFWPIEKRKLDPDWEAPLRANLAEGREENENELERRSSLIIRDIEASEDKDTVKKIRERVRNIQMARKMLAVMGIEGLKVVPK